MLFFFSSRRRHTRLQGDWSSDVCSSDLRALQLHLAVDQRVVDGFGGKRTQDLARRGAGRGRGVTAGTRPLVNGGAKIGRASCREGGDDAARSGSLDEEAQVIDEEAPQVR